MTDREMRKLSRGDLLELLIEQMRENERLTALLAEKDAQLESRRIEIEQAGSIAEASLRLNQVFSSAQAAADQYLENIRSMEEKTDRACRELLADAQSRWRKAELARMAEQQTTRSGPAEGRGTGDS